MEFTKLLFNFKNFLAINISFLYFICNSYHMCVGFLHQFTAVVDLPLCGWVHVGHPEDDNSSWTRVVSCWRWTSSWSRLGSTHARHHQRHGQVGTELRGNVKAFGLYNIWKSSPPSHVSNCGSFQGKEVKICICRYKYDRKQVPKQIWESITNPIFFI